MILPTTIIVAIAAVGVVALLLVLTALLCAGYTPTYCVSSVRKRLEAFRDRRQGDPEGSAVDSGVELPQYPGRADSTQPSPLLPPPTPSLPPPARLSSSRLPPSSPPPMDTPVSRSRAVNSPRRASSPVFAFMSPPTPAPRDRARSRPRSVRPDTVFWWQGVSSYERPRPL
ncbi:uncharacterized protein IWZ02DRAFT_238123 [Phyllosticta citriasiana]|uniref:uncharacterized protein n=1 Tax=Phyllosticta citriasiana TaxID=595635 RepID=UPI0030FD3A5B